MKEYPGYMGLLNEKIRNRVSFLSRALDLLQLEERFVHLNCTDGSWRRPLNIDFLKTHLSEFIDHTQLHPHADQDSFVKLCSEAQRYNFKTVCVNGSRVAFCRALLLRSDANRVKVCGTCGFPLGQMTTAMKAAEATEEIKNGAEEIDMVLNVGELKDRNYGYVYREISLIRTICEERGVILKVILETCLLTDEEIIDACVLSVAAGAHFVKTSTGFSTHGATPKALDIMLAVVGNEALVKASGGVRDRHSALEYLEAGVRRIGTSSGVDIVNENQSIERLKGDSY
ncbi:unnamed protein product [Phytomonas sp. EM1]|nr:unnamed protein product [Phytomonas sp. EM1]|eukprot:CCW61065.1 unnamed protein product [Phytomonas sp. isolate EM1]